MKIPVDVAECSYGIQAIFTFIYLLWSFAIISIDLDKDTYRVCKIYVNRRSKTTMMQCIFERKWKIGKSNVYGKFQKSEKSLLGKVVFFIEK